MGPPSLVRTCEEFFRRAAASTAAAARCSRPWVTRDQKEIQNLDFERTGAPRHRSRYCLRGVRPPTGGHGAAAKYENLVTITQVTYYGEGMGELVKPSELHDRVEEWRSLVEFASDTDPGTVLGIVYGRRRQGKTLLLELLTESAGGFVFTGLQQANTQNLADFSAAYAGFAGLPLQAFTNWTEAVDALVTVGERLGRPVPVVL